jgi:hypothetical protein
MHSLFFALQIIKLSKFQTLLQLISMRWSCATVFYLNRREERKRKARSITVYLIFSGFASVLLTYRDGQLFEAQRIVFKCARPKIFRFLR